MDYSKLLNQKQLEAVTTASSRTRVIAGAGSGKTRVLTYRIAYLINELHAEPWQILAITFTNKVAKEMKERVLKLIPEDSGNVYIQTYHAFCCRFLRQEIQIINYPSNFSIIDDEDQEKLVKDIAVNMGYKRSDGIVKKALNYISSRKCAGVAPDDVVLYKEHFEDEKECLEIYKQYEERLRQTLCLDFDDLLLKTLFILKEHPEIQSKWAHRIHHILIDEFQDTNDIQYELVHLLMSPSTTLFVVGDPDQTIYTWRGANQNIIMNIEKDYNAETIILDRNYRSTKTILDSANLLISHNKKRVPKDLFTENEQGEAIKINSSFRADDEANWVINEIEKAMKIDETLTVSDFAILYRSSYLTLPFEKALTRHRLAYRVFGGLRFYQRKEIKDVLAYFRLLSNKKDDLAFERIINVPKRNIGETTISYIKSEAAVKGKSIYEYVEEWSADGSEVREKVILDLRTLIGKIDDTRAALEKNDQVYSQTLKDFIVDIGYYQYLAVYDEDNADDRVKNVDSLFDDILSYIKDNPTSLFEEYLQNIALMSAQDDMEGTGYISLMTVHTAKGLEFPYVFVVGLNEGVFPNERAILENPVMGKEEERRLCYVAFTRAEKRLFLSCNQEYSYTLQSPKIISTFFKEAGLEFKSNRTIYDNDYFSHRGVQKPTTSSTNSYQFSSMKKKEELPKENGIEWHVGDIAMHESFGEGIVKRVDGNIIDVDFKEIGLKTMVGSHPKLSLKEKGGFDA